MMKALTLNPSTGSILAASHKRRTPVRERECVPDAIRASRLPNTCAEFEPRGRAPSAASDSAALGTIPHRWKNILEGAAQCQRALFGLQVDGDVVPWSAGRALKSLLFRTGMPRLTWPTGSCKAGMMQKMPFKMRSCGLSERLTRFRATAPGLGCWPSFVTSPTALWMPVNGHVDSSCPARISHPLTQGILSRCRQMTRRQKQLLRLALSTLDCSTNWRDCH